MKKSKKTNVILRETKNLMRSFTFVQDDRESGRSMVEMLGVLAIIGVLSVGGIAGYTSAMRQYKANEIVNATSMLYMMGASQNQGAGDKQMLYSGALGTVPSGVSEITYNAGKTITLAFTDTDVCPLVKNKLGDKATGECPTLTVSFGETTVSSTPDNEEDCVQAGKYWMYGDSVLPGGCYNSEEALSEKCYEYNTYSFAGCPSENGHSCFCLSSE